MWRRSRRRTGGAAAVVTVRQPCWSNLHIPDDPAPASVDPQHANGDNAMGGFEGLSRANRRAASRTSSPAAAGQWYLDQPGSPDLTTNHWQGRTPSSTTACCPVLESLFTGDGIANLTVRGLTFAHTTWRQPSGDDGFAEMQANMTLTGINASGSNPASGRPPQGTCQYTTPHGTCPFAAWTRPPASVDVPPGPPCAVRREHVDAPRRGGAHGRRGSRTTWSRATRSPTRRGRASSSATPPTRSGMLPRTSPIATPSPTTGCTTSRPSTTAGSASGWATRGTR